MNTKLTPKEIFIANKHRKLMEKLPQQVEDYQPEYERMNREPIVNKVADDFKYAQRKPIQVNRNSSQSVESEQLKKSKVAVSGYNEELSWIPKSEISSFPRPIETYQQDPNEYKFPYQENYTPPPRISNPQ